MTALDLESPTASSPPGRSMIGLDLAGTVGFIAAGGMGLASTDFRGVTVGVSLALFAIGVASFLWSFFTAAERSRVDEIGVANLYLLTGATAPPRVKRLLSGLLFVQVVACLVFGALGFSGLDDTEINPMAFGVLVPMFGLGLNGLWASRHGVFGPRIVSAPVKRRRQNPPSASDLEKNARHG